MVRVVTNPNYPKNEATDLMAKIVDMLNTASSQYGPNIVMDIVVNLCNSFTKDYGISRDQFVAAFDYTIANT